MKKILEKIYEDFPELKNDKEKVDKLVYFLNENKPIIEASKEFKVNLKSRLDSYIGLKQKKKSGFLIFALPVFSFCFVFLGVFYYLGLDKIDDKNLVSINTFDEQNNFQEKAQFSRMMISGSEEIEDLVEDKVTSGKYENKFIEEKIIDNENVKIEKIEILNDFPNVNEQEIAYFDGSNDDYSGGESMMLMSVFMDASFYEEISFNDYCDENSGEFIQYISENNEKLYKCIIEEKTCLEEKYNNGYCEFEEK